MRSDRDQIQHPGRAGVRDDGDREVDTDPCAGRPRLGARHSQPQLDRSHRPRPRTPPPRSRTWRLRWLVTGKASPCCIVSKLRAHDRSRRPPEGVARRPRQYRYSRDRIVESTGAEARIESKVLVYGDGSIRAGSVGRPGPAGRASRGPRVSAEEPTVASYQQSRG